MDKVFDQVTAARRREGFVHTVRVHTNLYRDNALFEQVYDWIKDRQADYQRDFVSVGPLFMFKNANLALEFKLRWQGIQSA